MNNRVDGKVCVVTGAGQGIGRGCAMELAKAGGKVVVSDLRAETGNETVSLIEAEGGQAIFVPCDVRSREQVEALMQASADHFGGIDVLHNNAGVHETDLTPTTSLWDLPEEIWTLVQEVNVRSIWYASRAALPWLKQSTKGATIINTASLSSHIAMPFSSAYCASKGAVLMLTRAMAVDLANFGIRVNCVCPGSINTGPLKNYFDRIDDPEAKAALEKSMLGGNLIPRLGEPEEIGKLICFLASNDSAYVNGADFKIDAGVTIWRGALQ